jgi:hypothetical protein
MNAHFADRMANVRPDAATGPTSSAVSSEYGMSNAKTRRKPSAPARELIARSLAPGRLSALAFSGCADRH